MENDGNVSIPDIVCPGSEAELARLQQEVDPLSLSESYGMDLYEHALHIITLIVLAYCGYTCRCLSYFSVFTSPPHLVYVYYFVTLWMGIPKLRSESGQLHITINHKWQTA